MDKYLVFGLTLLSLQDIIHGNDKGDNKTYVYVDEHETVKLRCGRQNLLFWGPTNLTIYVSGGKINKDLKNYKRLSFKSHHTANTSELQIREFSKEDEGLYRCSYRNNGSYIMIENTVMIKRDPKNITILETHNNIMFVISNQQINITCNVESGIPKETIIWISNETELARGGPSSLTYTFTPGHEYHLQKFSCIVLTGSTSLAKSVQLFLYFPPNVHILQANSVSVMENTSLDLRCNYTSNNAIKDIMWKYRNTKLTNSSQLHLESISREQKGEYYCTVLNLAASATANVTIDVLYPPRVTVSFSDKDGKRTLKCHPDGFPDRYDFMKWEHTTELKEHIRFLPSTKNGIITIPNITNETDRHNDRGIYICYVSNNISVDGRKFVSAKYLLNSTGRPYFVTSNNATQYSILNQRTVLTVDIVTYEKLVDAALFADEMKICDSSSIQYPVMVRDTMYGNIVIVHGIQLMFPITTYTTRDFRQYTVVVGNAKGSSSYLITLKPARQLRAPQNLKAVALDTQIIVKWTGNHDGGLQKTFFVEYRKHFELLWSQVSAENKSTAILNGLQPGAVYFLRVFSKTAAGKSSKSDIIIVKTEKCHSKIKVFTVELGMILGMTFIVFVICWCGNKALTYKQRSTRIQDIRGTLSRRNDETIMRPAHYDEIDSMYYNPLNATVSHQASRNNVQDSTRQALNVNLGDWQANNISNRNVLCTVHQLKSSRDNNSLTSSSDESYLVPCRNYIDLDNVKITENEHQDTSIEETAINLDETSISSNNSETNIKVIRKYEALNVSDIYEHCYKKCNETEESQNQ